MPEVAGEAAESEDGDIDANEMTQSWKEENPKKRTKKSEKGEYEHTQEANIAKNVELLCKLKEKYPLSDNMKVGEKNTMKGKMKAKVKTLEEPARTAVRIKGLR
jgi:hypothetical protein